MATLMRIFSGDGLFPTLWEVVISLSFWFPCCLVPGASSTSRSYASSVKRERGFELEVFFSTTSGLYHSQLLAWPTRWGTQLPFKLFFCLESQASQRWEGEGVIGGCGLEGDDQKYSFVEHSNREWVSQCFPLCSVNTTGCLLTPCNISRAEMYPWIEGQFHQNLHQNVLFGELICPCVLGKGRSDTGE